MNKFFDSGGAGGIEEHLRSQNVGADEGTGVENAAIDMALGREMDDAVNALDGGPHGLAVGNVAMHEAIARIVSRIRQVRQVAGVGQSVEIDDVDIGLVFENIVDEVAADEAATSCHKHRNHGPS